MIGQKPGLRFVYVGVKVARSTEFINASSLGGCLSISDDMGGFHAQ